MTHNKSRNGRHKKATARARIIQVTCVLALAVFALAISSFAIGRLNTASRQIERQKEEPATKVQEGVMTQRQREHSKLFIGSGKNNGKKLTEFSEPGEAGFYRAPPMPISMPNIRHNNSLQGITCLSDVILIATVKDKTSQLTEDGDYIFTEYDVSVETVLKNNPAAPVHIEDHLIYVRPGGKVNLNGRDITISEAVYPHLNVGSRYLLFLRYIPSTGAYRNPDISKLIVNMVSIPTYEIVGDKISKHSEAALPKEIAEITESADFIAKVQSAVSGDCSNQNR